MSELIVVLMTAGSQEEAGRIADDDAVGESRATGITADAGGTVEGRIAGDDAVDERRIAVAAADTAAVRHAPVPTDDAVSDRRAATVRAADAGALVGVAIADSESRDLGGPGLSRVEEEPTTAVLHVDRARLRTVHTT